MPIETERRFLVQQIPGDLMKGYVRIRQGYLNLDPDRTVRVRVVRSDDNHLNPGICYARLTVKGPKNSKGSGSEYEYDIPTYQAEEMLNKMCVGCVIDKKRYTGTVDGHTVEVDVFGGQNEGLVIAEVEHESGSFHPSQDWVEITDDPATWSNASLATNPLKGRVKDNP
jgi:adenylate cyclase